MSDGEEQELSRRKFIQIAAGSLTAASFLGGCARGADINQLTAVTAAQKLNRRNGDSSLAILKCDSYEQDIFGTMKPFLKDLGLPDFHGKTVVIKPNMIDVIPPKPITTNPAVIQAAVQLCDYLGAKEVIIAEGAAHNRDTEFLLHGSGIGALVKKLGLRFVDLNVDDVESVDNPHPFSKLDHIYFPKTILKADALVSVPKMKTHHWARVTCSMKNLYGCVPGRMYGWPKNVLHYNGIDNCILDLTRLLKPAMQVVDAIVAMEGDGPIMGTAKDSKFVMLGTDCASVDATACRTMGIDPQNVPYIKFAGEVIGNIDPSHIKIFGEAIETVATQFRPSPLFDPSGKRINNEDPTVASS